MGWFGSGKADPPAATGSPDKIGQQQHIGKQLEDGAVKERADSKLPRTTRDEDAEAELQQWLATFQQDTKEAQQPPAAPLKSKPTFPSPSPTAAAAAAPPPPSLPSTPSLSSSWLPSWFTKKDETVVSASSPATSDTTIRTLPTRTAISPLSRLEQIDLHKIADTARPTSLSCSQAFDYAQGCQFMRGQFLNVYRYGETRSCSHLWSQFWRCMRSRSATDAQKETIYDEIWLEREKRWRLPGVPSSEDVWEARTEKVRNPYPYLPPESLD